RRLITRMIAIVPAFFVIWFYGESATGKLLVLSQVVLSLQLAFAMVPLVYFVGERRLMGQFKVKPLVLVIAWVCVALILGLNIQSLWGTVGDFMRTLPTNFVNPLIL